MLIGIILFYLGLSASCAIYSARSVLLSQSYEVFLEHFEPNSKDHLVNAVPRLLPVALSDYLQINTVSSPIFLTIAQPNNFWFNSN